MKERYKKILSTVICCLLFLILFFASWNFFMRKGSYRKNEDFYSYKENYDVLFLGTSHVVMGVSPMELWKEYGIVSYNLANHGQWLPVDYWVLKNALQYTKPKLVVLDIRAIDINDNKVSPEHALQTHESFDRMPLSKTKIDAVYDLFPKGKRMEYLFDFSIYHTRWKEINSTFWDKAEPSTEKGANLDSTDRFAEARIFEVPKVKIIKKKKMNRAESLGKEYLRKIIALCKEQNIDLLLTSLPYYPNAGYQEWLNSAQLIADENGIPYFDMITEDMIVNANIDFFDEDHLNSSGAKKATRAIGEYLKKNYDLPDKRNSDAAAEWDQDYADYEAFKLDWLKQQTSLDTYLMLLFDKSYNAIIEIYNTKIWKDARYAALFENLGVDLERVTEDTDCIVIGKGGETVDLIENFHDSEGVTETGIGSVCLFIDEMDEENRVKSYGVYIDDEKRYTAGLGENVDIRILTLDPDSGQTEDYVTFSYSVKKQKGYRLTLHAMNGIPYPDESKVKPKENTQ